MHRVLVIDDDDQVRTALRLAFEDAGYDAYAAGSVPEGLRLHQRRPADVVVTDIMMPGQDGLELIMQLREISAVVKIIAISGGGQIVRRDYLREAELLGAARTFHKPFDTRDLLAAVGELTAAV